MFYDLDFFGNLVMSILIKVICSDMCALDVDISKTVRNAFIIKCVVSVREPKGLNNIVYGAVENFVNSSPDAAIFSTEWFTFMVPPF